MHSFPLTYQLIPNLFCKIHYGLTDSWSLLFALPTSYFCTMNQLFEYELHIYDLWCYHSLKIHYRLLTHYLDTNRQWIPFVCIIPYWQLQGVFDSSLVCPLTDESSTICHTRDDLWCETVKEHSFLPNHFQIPENLKTSMMDLRVSQNVFLKLK